MFFTTRSLPVTQTLELASRLEATIIHGITGRPVSECVLEPGELISSLTGEEDFDAGHVWIFLCSSNGGASWDRAYSYNLPDTRPINPRFADCEDEHGSSVTVCESRGPKPPAAARKAIR